VKNIFVRLSRQQQAAKEPQLALQKLYNKFLSFYSHFPGASSSTFVPILLNDSCIKRLTNVLLIIFKSY